MNKGDVHCRREVSSLPNNYLTAPCMLPNPNIIPLLPTRPSIVYILSFVSCLTLVIVDIYCIHYLRSLHRCAYTLQ